MLSILDHNMVGAVRIVSVERGHDPRDFTLVPFGGAGPLHGCSLAALLGITRVLVPPAPGVLCADGLLAADLKAEFSRTLPKAGAVDIEMARKIFAELTAQADDWLTAEKVAPQDRQQSKVAMLRYHGQGGEVAGPVGRRRCRRRGGLRRGPQGPLRLHARSRRRARDLARRSDRPHARAAAADAGQGHQAPCRATGSRCISNRA